MKKQPHIFVALLCTVFMACDKIVEDPRAKYTGNFSINVSQYLWDPGMTHAIDTTYSFDGEIKYGGGDFGLILYRNNNVAYVFDLEEDGSLTGPGGAGYFQDYSHFVLSRQTANGHILFESSKIMGTRK